VLSYNDNGSIFIKPWNVWGSERRIYMKHKMEEKGSFGMKSLNRNMTKKDICDRVAGTLGESDFIKPVIETFLDELLRAMATGFRVEIRGFGCFKPVIRRKRQGRNPRTGEAVTIPEYLAPWFKFSRDGCQRFVEKMSIASIA
jgi:nucleoid DNA-binding protein